MVADTPENLRLKQQSELQSQVGKVWVDRAAGLLPLWSASALRHCNPASSPPPHLASHFLASVRPSRALLPGEVCVGLSLARPPPPQIKAWLLQEVALLRPIHWSETARPLPIATPDLL